MVRSSSWLRRLAVLALVLAGLSTFQPALAGTGGGSITIISGITALYPAGWSLAPAFFANAQKLVNVPIDQQASLDRDSEVARVMVTTETRTNHAEAVMRLQQISTETVGGVQSGPACVAVCGWAAVQRTFLVPRPQEAEAEADQNGEEQLLRITTAVAVENFVIRVEGSVDPATSMATIAEINAIGQSLANCPTADPVQTQSDIQTICPAPPITLRGQTPDSTVASAQRAPGASWVHAWVASAAGLWNRAVDVAQALIEPAAAFAAALRLGEPFSEMEVAVSSDAKNVVVCGQFNYATSNDGGVTFPFTGGFPMSTGGDCSLAFGKSTNFYEATINSNSLAFNFSTDNGRTFGFRTNAVTCPTMGANACSPDQEHIVADRVTAASGGGDQAYMVWRNFDATDQDPAIVCSQDGGATWTAPVNVGSGYVPRVNIGQDGFVYVIYRTVGMTGGDIMLNKYSSCTSGLVQQSGFPLKVTSVTDVPCPVPGLDRCNLGANILSSHMVAVDDTNANHVFVSYTSHTASGNDDVFVIGSTDGGKMWGTAVRINAAVTATRFMPWICTVGGAARLSWYDRRAVTGGATNDLTDYFCGSASGSGAGLTAGPELDITNAPDPQCAGGKTPGSAASWPCQSRGTGGAESCTVQPQLAGQCRVPNPPPTPTPNPSTNTPCDFSDCGVCEGGKCVGTATACTTDADCTRSGACACGNTENCQGGSGCPKYGDYNGNACGLGRVYTTWASGTAPMGLSAPNAIAIYFQSKLANPTAGVDLGITKVDAPDPVVAGTDLTYTITVTGDPAIPALQVKVDDTLPPGTTFVSLAAPAGFTCTTPAVGGTGAVSCTRNFTAPGDVAVFTLVVKTSASLADGSTITNTATVSSADPDLNPNNSATATTAVITRADLAITKAGTPDPVLPGGALFYTVDVVNNGPSDAQNVVVTQQLPPETTFTGLSAPAGWNCVTPPVGQTGTVTCTLPTLANGGTATFIICVRVSTQVQPGQTFDCAVTVTSTTVDPNPANNSFTAQTEPFLPIPAAGTSGLVALTMALAWVGVRYMRRRRGSADRMP